ncbi:hypothetical protein LTSEMON_5141 [Salmonella enterica subsp. enterica serovar Montevideo str. S5-403]|uniref:Uncharacterized protein n=1 Tax=Salmonella enterica subsp. enterica serovar Montevideo str. S5-403 TaxID=913242 RepID=G5Q9M9_SALMO|nr:hypothetical protein LTSEMON_5141 [Salmonella enterica subsp. enterica serovar Montevideo str. S5-403]
MPPARCAPAAGTAVAGRPAPGPARGWTARADLTDLHPLTGRALPRAVWWIIETKE